MGLERRIEDHPASGIIVGANGLLQTRRLTRLIVSIHVPSPLMRIRSDHTLQIRSDFIGGIRSDLMPGKWADLSRHVWSDFIAEIWSDLIGGVLGTRVRVVPTANEFVRIGQEAGRTGDGTRHRWGIKDCITQRMWRIFN